ncbi:MAG: hypothetical protein KJ792_12900 [Actinobacteria bacterium]|nr:hypothetical protein [Actinomycetota bacterium]MCG2803087.1 hypothetical protein [Cellulomonas sp.]
MPQTDVTQGLAISARWMSSLSTLVASFGPRSWEDVESTVDYVLTGTPQVPPQLTRTREIERTLSGYEAAHRTVLEGLGEVPTGVVLRWARLRTALRGRVPGTMMPVAGGLVEVLLEDASNAFGPSAPRVPVDVVVLERLVEEVGLPATSVLLAAFQPGPDSTDPLPSRACDALAAMRGYDESLVRHAATMRLHMLGFDPRAQVRAARMLERAATPTLRAYAEVVAAWGESSEAAVRAAARPLAQRLEASRPQPRRLDAVPSQRQQLADRGAPGYQAVGISWVPEG